MLKRYFAGLQKKVGEVFSVVPLSPNQITLLSVLVAIAGAYLVFEKNPWGPAVIFIVFAMDGLDGAIARRRGISSKFGAYLDGISDRLVEFFALLGLLLEPLLALPALLVLFFGTCMTSFSKAYATHRGVADEKISAGMKTILPRAERVILIFASLLLFVFGYPNYASYVLWAIAVLSIISFIGIVFGIKKGEE